MERAKHRALHVDGVLEVRDEGLDLDGKENMGEAKALKYFHSNNVKDLKPRSAEYFF